MSRHLHTPWQWLWLAIALIILGSPNRILHFYPAALVGLAPLIYWGWQVRGKRLLGYTAIVWVGVCAVVFLPNPFSVPALHLPEVLAGALVSPLVPLYFVAVTYISVTLSRPCPLWIKPVAIAAVWTAFDGSFALLQVPLPLHLGACLFDALPLIQIADITGIWGVTFLLVAVNGAISAAFSAGPNQRWQACVAAGVIVFGVLGYGELSLSQSVQTSEHDRYRVAMVQQVAWLERQQPWDYRRAKHEELRAWSQEGIDAGAELVLWPEGATRLQVEGSDIEEELIIPLVIQLPENGGLLTGSSEPAPGELDRPWNERRYINTALLYSSDGMVSDRYGKQWLFPYFETVRFVPSPDGYRPLVAGDVIGRLGVVICLESVLPQASRELTRRGAQSLVAIADDSWFGWSNWPTLHGVLSVFRALENRRSFAFVNNTGGNLVVAPSGEIIVWGQFWQQDVVMGDAILNGEKTLYNRWGDWFVWICWGVTGGLGLVAIAKPYRSKTKPQEITDPCG